MSVSSAWELSSRFKFGRYLVGGRIGFGGNVYIDDVQFHIISYDCENPAARYSIAREKIVFGQLCVGDRVVDEAEKAPSIAVVRVVLACSGVVGEVRVGLGR